MPRVSLCVWLWGSPWGSQLLDMSIGTYGHLYGCGRRDVGMGMCRSCTPAHVCTLIYMSAYPPRSTYICLLSSVCVYTCLLSGLHAHAGAVVPICISACPVWFYTVLCRHMSIYLHIWASMYTLMSLCLYIYPCASISMHQIKPVYTCI